MIRSNSKFYFLGWIRIHDRTPLFRVRPRVGILQSWTDATLLPIEGTSSTGGWYFDLLDAKGTSRPSCEYTQHDYHHDSNKHSDDSTTVVPGQYTQIAPWSRPVNK